MIGSGYENLFSFRLVNHSFRIRETGLLPFLAPGSQIPLAGRLWRKKYETSAKIGCDPSVTCFSKLSFSILFIFGVYDSLRKGLLYNKTGHIAH